MIVAGWVLVAAMVAVGVAIIGRGVRERRWYDGFCRRAVPARAEVTGASTHRGPGEDAHGRPTGTRWYREHVRYPGPDGTAVTSRVRYPVARRPVLGEAVEVRYDPERPRRVVRVGTRPPGAAATAVVGGAVLVAAYLVQALVRTFA